MSNSQLRNRFLTSYNALYLIDDTLTNYYVTEYYENDDWNWNEIDESVVRNLEKDVENYTRYRVS